MGEIGNVSGAGAGSQVQAVTQPGGGPATVVSTSCPECGSRPYTPGRVCGACGYDGKPKPKSKEVCPVCGSASGGGPACKACGADIRPKPSGQIWDADQPPPPPPGR